MLNADGRARSPGLYVAGSDQANVMGGHYPSGGINIGPAMTFGYIAGRHAAGVTDYENVDPAVERRRRRAGMATAPLVVSSYTLGTEVSFVDRVRAAAAAGFEGIGLRAENYWDAGLDDAEMLAVAEQHGVRILEVEYLTAWGTPADRDEAQQHKEQTVFHMARAFGVRHVNAGLLETLPLDVMTDAFAALCGAPGRT